MEMKQGSIMSKFRHNQKTKWLFSALLHVTATKSNSKQLHHRGPERAFDKPPEEDRGRLFEFDRPNTQAAGLPNTSTSM